MKYAKEFVEKALNIIPEGKKVGMFWRNGIKIKQNYNGLIR